MAHVKASPAAICAMVPVTLTGTGDERSVVVPSPSSPKEAVPVPFVASPVAAVGQVAMGVKPVPAPLHRRSSFPPPPAHVYLPAVHIVASTAVSLGATAASDESLASPIASAVSPVSLASATSLASPASSASLMAPGLLETALESSSESAAVQRACAAA